MKTRKNLLMIISVIFASLIGGALINVVFMTQTSVAQVGKTPEKVISAQEFRLVNASGKTRATLAVGALGGVTLNFYDLDNKSRAVLGLSANGSPSLKLSNGGALELRDERDRVRSKIVMLSDGSPSIRLFDEVGNSRAIIGSINLENPETARISSLEKRPESSLVLLDKDKKVVWSAP